jgi:hypothetical protein
MNSKTSVGEYKHVAAVVSDLNIMIQEAPINNKYRCELADMVWELKKEETLKNLYQFLHEITHGMYGDNTVDIHPDREDLPANAQDLLEEMEDYFAIELSPPDNDNSTDHGTTDYPDVNYLKPSYSKQ